MIEIGKVRLFTIDEVGKKFGTSGHTIRKYIKQGRLAGQRVGRRLFVSEQALQNFFESTYFKPKTKKSKN